MLSALIGISYSTAIYLTLNGTSSSTANSTQVLQDCLLHTLQLMTAHLKQRKANPAFSPEPCL